MKYKYLFAVLAATVATPVVAQDFAGPRVEARAGWTDVGIEAEIDGEEGNDSTDAVTLGGEVGFDAMMGTNFVLGGYVGLDVGEAEFCEEVLGDDEACLEAGRNITVGVRGGVPLGQSVLLYAKGGYSNGRLRASYEDFEDEDFNFSASDSLDGWHLGAGFELAAGPNVYLKAEYVYTMYNGSETDDEDFDATFDIDRQQALIGVGFRF